MKKVKNVLFIVAALFYLVSGIMLYKGHDKLTNYYNSEYTTLNNVNAYVGGDAYNYIINGNYATGFFVLSMGFMIAATICLTSGLTLAALKETEKEDSLPTQEEEIINE